MLSVVPLEPHHHLNMTKVSSRSKSLIKLCVACHDTRVEVRQELDPVTQGRACVLTMLLLMQVAYSLCLCGSMYAYVHMHMGAEARGQPRALFLRHCLYFRLPWGHVCACAFVYSHPHACMCAHDLPRCTCGSQRTA